MADTTPLRYLVEIGYESLLPQLFTKVWIPRAVAHELQGRGAPEIVRQWTGRLPSWVDERSGARVARGHGFAVTGTLGVLVEAARSGFVIIDEALAPLAKTNFRRTDELFEQTQQRARMPRGNA